MPLTSYNSRIVTPASGAAGFLPGEIKQITFGGFAASEIDTTFLASASKTYAMGVKDNGTVTVVTNVNAVAANKPPVPVSGGTAVSYTIRLGGSGTSGLQFIFSAFHTGTTIETGVDAVVTATYTLQISGDVTISYS